MDYLKVGKAKDLENKRDRIIFRCLEIFPGFLTWATLIGAVVFSYLFPSAVAIFVIVFVLYWLFKTIYFSFHLKSGYQKMRQNEKIDWAEKLKKMPESRDIYHLITLPMYEEPLSIVRESFKALLRTDYPKDKFIVVLACEERAGEKNKKIVEAVQKEFGDKFFKLLITFHPADIPGEIAGKGSNETWGIRRVKEKIIDVLKIPYKNIIVSCFDIDTSVFPKYFSCLTHYYLASGKSAKKSFQPVPLFINNAWEAPAISRLFSFSSSFWQLMNQERPEKLITFSSHSMSFQALSAVGFKQVNVVSEDSRIFWQCFLKYNGDYQVQPIYYPVSMDANVAPTLFQTLQNIYKQQRRWAYGVADLPYFLFGFLKNKKIPFLKKVSFAHEFIEGHWAWATSSAIILFLGWLPLLLGGADFSRSMLSYNLPKITSYILTISMFGLISSAYFSLLLLPPKSCRKFGRFKSVFLTIGQWLLLPFVMIFFTALPAIDAQTRLMLGKYMGFWVTPKTRRKELGSF